MVERDETLKPKPSMEAKLGNSTWAKAAEYRDIDGREVIELEDVDGPTKGTKRYFGRIALTFKNDKGQVQNRVPFQFDFPEGKSRNWVFKNFDSEAQKAVSEWEKDQQELSDNKKIVHPNGSGEIITPDFGRVK
jgi:hypothetical protein